MDPQANDVDTYIQFAKAKGMEIKYVVDTHVQADHVSGGRTLAQLTGANYCLHESADVAFEVTALTDHQELDLGNVSIRVHHTPGHTQESICLLVTDKTKGAGTLVPAYRRHALCRRCRPSRPTRPY